MSSQRIRIFVTGRVQGVFFRQALKIMAKKNNVFGWVKNLKDGRVESVLEGDAENVSKIVEWVHGGPANAIVENVEIHNETFVGEFSKMTFCINFKIKFLDNRKFYFFKKYKKNF